MNMTETPDAFALNQNPMRLLLHALEESGIQTLANLVNVLGSSTESVTNASKPQKAC